MNSYLKTLNANIYRGIESNVFKRYYDAIKYFNSDVIIRLTGDCIFLDYLLIDRQIEFLIKNKFDYITNTNPPTFPDGLDFEIFSRSAFEKANKISKNTYENEHVTPIFKYSNNSNKKYKNKIDLSQIKLSIDTFDDLKLIRKLVTTNPICYL